MTTIDAPAFGPKPEAPESDENDALSVTVRGQEYTVHIDRLTAQDVVLATQVIGTSPVILEQSYTQTDDHGQRVHFTDIQHDVAVMWLAMYQAQVVVSYDDLLASVTYADIDVPGHRG